MSTYEKIATILACIAIVQPWFLKLYYKYFSRLKLKFIANNKIQLFYNRSGAYIQLTGAIEAKNKDVAIKNIASKIIRRSDNAEMNLSWSTFPSYAFQTMGDNLLRPSEIAHPFCVESNRIAPICIEFCNSDYSLSNNLEELYIKLKEKAEKICCDSSDPEESLCIYRAEDVYKNSRDFLLENHYWKESEYTLDIIVQFNDDKKKHFKFSFLLTSNDATKIKNNISSLLDSPLLNKYQQNIVLYSPFVDIKEEI